MRAFELFNNLIYERITQRKKMTSLLEELLRRRLDEDILRIGSKAYIVCPICKKLVRLNKPIIGSLYLCIGENEDG